MKSNKITQLHVYIIGFVLFLIVGGAGFYFLIKPLNEDNAAVLSNISGVEGTAVTVDKEQFKIAAWDPVAMTDPSPDAVKKVEADAQAALDAAKQRQEAKTAQLESVLRRKSVPPSQSINISNDPEKNLQGMRSWFTLPEYVVTLMSRHAQRLASANNVKVTTQFKAPAPSTDPTAIPKDIIAWNLGQMTVEGKFPNVMKWAEAWNRAPLLVSVDGLKMSVANRGGVVQGTCTLTVFVFPKGEAVVIPGGGGGGAAPGAPGMPTMPGAPMMPGAPPGGGPSNAP